MVFAIFHCIVSDCTCLSLWASQTHTRLGLLSQTAEFSRPLPLPSLPHPSAIFLLSVAAATVFLASV